MIARVHFESTVKCGKKKSTTEDYVDIHVADTGQAKEMFLAWTNISTAIKGANGVFHPLGIDGSVKIKKVGVPGETKG